MQREIAGGVLVFCPLFLVYSFVLIQGFRYVQRTIGWTGFSEALFEQNPMFFSCAVFAVTTGIFTLRFQLRFRDLKWLAVLNYATVLIFLIAIEWGRRSSSPPQPFYG